MESRSCLAQISRTPLLPLYQRPFCRTGSVLAASKERFPGQSVYHIKWIQWKEENTPIITQNENGPCPLLAILNVLLLAWKNMSDAMAVLHKLQTGLDVNVKFTGVRVFEYTPECIVFDLLDIPLYHGWLVDPQIDDIVKAVGNCSYNQLVEKIISCKQSDNSELVSEGFVAEQFLNNTATQLTYHGLCELTSTVQEGELCVFFRNNHFSTMTKYKDYLMALSLQQEQQSHELNWEQIPEGISDLELAKKLQEEEDRRASQYYQEQEQAAAAAASASASTQAQITMLKHLQKGYLHQQLIGQQQPQAKKFLLMPCTGFRSSNTSHTLY
ncbi:hypothetical protein CB1_000598001 [Camelus ferus]|nr:hypothetical protein CB1_000598001 [Camelus ferus]